jgi:hypothetical protein
MTFEFRPAVRENVGLLVSLSGGTGSGKTFSAMRLAAGISGEKPFAVVDTEAGRARHYADKFRFDHGDLAPPFSPDRYAEAIKAADDAKYPVIVVDSASHEHSGDGGLLDMHDAELNRMAADDWKKREACKMAAWIKPKTQHKAMVNKLLQVRAHLILCLRAEEKVEMVRGDDGKMKIVPKKTRTGKDGWAPICEKNLPFEMTCSFLLLADNPGVPQPIKLEEQLRHIFPADKPIDEASGRALAAWASGAKAESVSQKSTDIATDNNVPYRNRILEEAEAAAEKGRDAIKAFMARCSADSRTSLEPHRQRLWDRALEVDRENTP